MSDIVEELLIKVESLKNMLVARATGGTSSDTEYKQLGTKLSTDEYLTLKVQLPPPEPC